MIPSAVITRASLCFATLGYKSRFCGESSLQHPQKRFTQLVIVQHLACWGGVAYLEWSNKLPWYSLHCTHPPPQYSLYPLIALMHWRKQTLKHQGWRELLRAVQGSACNIHDGYSHLLLLRRSSEDTFHKKEISLLLFFQTRKSSAVRWSGFPRSPQDADRNIAASVTPALCASHMLLHPESEPKCHVPTRINSPGTKILKSFTRVTGTVRSCSLWAEQHWAKRTSNTNHKTLQFVIIYQHLSAR